MNKNILFFKKEKMLKNCMDKPQNNWFSVAGGLMNDFNLLTCSCLTFAIFSTVTIHNFHNLL